MEYDIKLKVRQFKALSNEHRLTLFLKILEHEHLHGRTDGCAINAVVCDWKICAPTVSHHIRILESARLIDVEKSGKFIVARLNLDSYEMSMRLFHARPAAEHLDTLLQNRGQKTNPSQTTMPT